MLLAPTAPIVYPNPVRDGLVRIKIPGGYSDALMNVFDLQGKQVVSLQIDSDPVDISVLSKGIYFVKLVCPDKVLVTKFAKE